ncbi:MAG: polysaccharide biosynthesis/export family protein [Sneathiella sp.]
MRRICIKLNYRLNYLLLLKISATMLCIQALGFSLANAQTQQNNNDTPFQADSNNEQDSSFSTEQFVRVQPSGGELEQSAPSIERQDNVPISEEAGNLGQIEILPFGSQLFAKSNFLDQSLGVNAAYSIAPGDRIAVKMWGARLYESILSVDVQGNIFIPEIGPIFVEGVKNSQLNSVISGSVSKIFTKNVKTYTNLLGAQPIGVYVTGSVKFPGHFPGARGDNVLYFLSRAGGIDPESGSFRNIFVRRSGKTVATIDLYKFLINGDLPDIEFRDKDTIVVGPQYATVTVLGDVKNTYKYEFDPNNSVGRDIIALAAPIDTASHVLLQGIRGEKAVSQFIPLQQANNTALFPGDILTIESDHVTSQITVKVQGNNNGASTLSIKRSTLLGQVANLIEADPLTHDLSAIYLRRQSVADRQKRAIERSLYELQRSVLTGSSSSTSGSAIRIQEANLIDKFVSQARAVLPEGRVVLAGVDWSQVHLEDGDEIVIPEKSDVIFISGEVKVPQTILWREDFTPTDYFKAAGGLSNRGDPDRLIVLKRNGSVHDGSKPIQKGDHIMVLPELDTKVFAMVKDLIEITYRVALSAAVVLNAND